jgi:hypothetical protein
MPRQRDARYTVLIYCEGQTEFAFIKYIKAIFVIRGEREVKIRKGKGGGLSTHISDVRGICQSAAFQEKFIILDEDNRPNITAQTLTEATSEQIQLIWPQPCIEGLFLTILEENFNFRATASAHCKRQFEERYLNKDQKLESKNYERHLTKELLEQKRATIPALDQLIRTISGT